MLLYMKYIKVIYKYIYKINYSKIFLGKMYAIRCHSQKGKEKYVSVFLTDHTLIFMAF